MAESKVENIHIKEFSSDLIPPTVENMFVPDQGGAKITVIGKAGCFSIGTRILTYSGDIITVENVTKGMLLMGDDNKPRKVLELCRGYEKMYEISPLYGEIISVNENHILSLKSEEAEVVNITVKDYLEKDAGFKKKYKWYYSTVEFPPVINEELEGKSAYEYTENLMKNDERVFPKFLLINSRQVRLEVLAAIIENIASFINPEQKSIIISQKSSYLIETVTFLARSLGFYVNFIKIPMGELGYYYQSRIHGKFSEIPFRKLKGLNDTILPTSVEFEIIELTEAYYYGFTLSDNHLFLLADFSVVHNTGKTTLIDRLLYEKKHIIPVAMIMSGTEDSNGHFKKSFENVFIHNKLEISQMNEAIRRQKISMKYTKNPWVIWISDDCTDDPRIFNKPLFQGLYKNGRHWKMLWILSVQYIMDSKTYMRTNTDGVFIGRETNKDNREKIYRNYASCIPDLNLFHQLMDELTNDHSWLFVRNNFPSNDWKDLVFYWKPTPPPKDWKFGSREYHEHAKARFNDEYEEPLY